jgi:plastocyanin
MKNALNSLALSAMILSGLSHGATVTGKIAFTGKAPKPTEIKMNADPGCVKANPGKVYSEDFVVNSNGTLANVFVYVKEGVKKETVPPAPATPVEFDQKGCRYTPHVFGVRVNQTVKVINSDPFLHNVNAVAKESSNKFNNAMPKQGQVIEKKFTKPETMVRVKCDVHGWMVAYIGVLDHPYFAVSDQTGAFSIKDLPPGDYTIEAWHENKKLGAKTQKVTVTDAGATVDFTFN